MKNGVFWDAKPRALVRTDVSEDLCASFTLLLRSMRQLLVTASVVPSSPILITLMKQALNSSETSVLTRATRLNIPEDVILLIFNFTCPVRCLRVAPAVRVTLLEDHWPGGVFKQVWRG
jgi:uncharacterized BrkB/YihY/UPF0761 family membrane protein